MESEEIRYTHAEQRVAVPILRRVVDSRALRSWLAPHIHARKQEGAAKWLGVSQATINRMLNKDEYDFPLDTVGRIAEAAGYKRLSDFVLALELGRTAESDTDRNVDANVTSPVHSMADNKPLHPQAGGAHGGGDRSVSIGGRRLEDILAHISEAIGQRASVLARARANRKIVRPDTKARHPRRKKG